MVTQGLSEARSMTLITKAQIEQQQLLANGRAQRAAIDQGLVAISIRSNRRMSLRQQRSEGVHVFFQPERRLQDLEHHR
jgi:hypothetical protein